jgi:hypothetical protein
MSNSIGSSVSSTVTTNTKPINPAQAQKEADFLEEQIRSFNAQVASLKAERQWVPLGRFGTFYEEPCSVVPKIARLQKEVASDRPQLNSPALAAAAALQVAVRGSQGAINKATTLAGKAAAYQRASNAVYQAATTCENTQHHSTPSGSYDANWTAQQATWLAPFLLTAEFDQEQADRYQTQADQAQLASLSADRKALGAMRSFLKKMRR